jgi:hypothetical protein
MEDALTNVVVASTVLLFFGFIVAFPHRFLHPFRGKAVHHDPFGMILFRTGACIPCIGGIRFLAIGLYQLLKHATHH